MIQCVIRVEWRVVSVTGRQLMEGAMPFSPRQRYLSKAVSRNSRTSATWLKVRES